MKHVLKAFLCAVLVAALTLVSGPALAKKQGKGAGGGRVEVEDAKKPEKSEKNAKPGKEKKERLQAEGFTVALLDAEGVIVTSDAASGSFTGIGGHKYNARVTVTPEGAKVNVKWKSDSPSVVSVSDKGVLFCKKPGTAEITVWLKGSELSQRFTLTVSANESIAQNAESGSASKVYLKGNHLYVDIAVANDTAEPITALPAQEVFLKLAGDAEYQSMGILTGTIKEPIQPGKIGTVSFVVMKADKRVIDLSGAQACFKVPEPAVTPEP